MAFALSESCLAGQPIWQPLWHGAAPRRLIRHCPPDDLNAGWTVWKKHLARRKRPRKPGFLNAKLPPILWGLPNIQLSRHQAVARTLATPPVPIATDLNDALQTVALAYSLPDLANQLSAESWWRLAERLHDVAIARDASRTDDEADPQHVLRDQLRHVELPLAMSYLFPEVRALRRLRKNARAALDEFLAASTDGQGLPHARLLPIFAPLLACWTRSRWLDDHLAQRGWSREARSQYAWLVRHALRLVDGDGRLMLNPNDGESAAPLPKRLLTTAAQLARKRSLQAAAAELLPWRGGSRGNVHRRATPPPPSLESDWSGICVLANGWSRSATRVALAFADDPVRVELTLGREPLLVGNWTHETTCDGRPVHVAGEWQQLCWESSRRFDLVELGVDLSDGLRLERQLLFARDSEVLYLTDIVLSNDDAPHRLQHSLRLPLAHGVAWHAEAETCDGTLVAGKRRAAVLPLGLPEWRSDPRGGTLAVDANRLVLTQETTGRAICCPLLFDFHSRRSKQERTWRQLTVGEALQVVPRDVAVAFRVQSGDDQWLFYRSLAPPGNRTFLGQNIAGEFAAGRFFATGRFKPWIEIEAV